MGTSLVVQWLRLCAPSAGGLGSIPGQGTRTHTLPLLDAWGWCTGRTQRDGVGREVGGEFRMVGHMYIHG